MERKLFFFLCLFTTQQWRNSLESNIMKSGKISKCQFVSLFKWNDFTDFCFFLSFCSTFFGSKIVWYIFCFWIERKEKLIFSPEFQRYVERQPNKLHFEMRKNWRKSNRLWMIQQIRWNSFAMGFFFLLSHIHGFQSLYYVNHQFWSVWLWAFW